MGVGFLSHQQKEFQKKKRCVQDDVHFVVQGSETW
jgi:hypothetical protein